MLVRFAAAAACFAFATTAVADPGEHKPELEDFVHGRPAEPTEAWTLAAGGRIYDTWWEALNRKKPEAINPAYPATGKRKGATTWRCVECHGWDYLGRDGLYGAGEHFTGIKGIRAAQGRDPQTIARMLRTEPHNYTPEMLKDEDLLRVARFVSAGQHTASRYIEPKSGKARGDAQRGAGFFQTICAACHGFDGRALNWGTKEEPGYIGTEARSLPWEVLHKIRNAHPGVAMVNLRALPMKDAADLLAYTQTLPAK